MRLFKKNYQKNDATIQPHEKRTEAIKGGSKCQSIPDVREKKSECFLTFEESPSERTSATVPNEEDLSESSGGKEPNCIISGDDATVPFSPYCSFLGNTNNEDDILLNNKVYADGGCSRYNRKNGFDTGCSTSRRYGCDVSTPDREQDTTLVYGYEYVMPDKKEDLTEADYGYGDGAPSIRSSNFSSYLEPHVANVASTRGYTNVIRPQRSSMKQNREKPRRASIQFGQEIEVNIPDGTTEGKIIKKKTSISFKETAIVRNILPARNLAENPEMLWFQEAEFKVIRQKAFAIIDRVEAGGVDVGGKKLCIRGLERFMPSAREEVSGRKYEAWDCVLDVQSLQRCSGEFDDEHIANVYKHTTMRTQEEAIARAMQDATEAQIYLKKTRKSHRRMQTM